MNELKDFVEVLRTRISILDIVSRRVKLAKKGHNYVGLCPFHHEKTGSFNVDISRGTYHCFGCGVHGDMFSFVMQSENISFMDAVKEIAELANLTVPKFTKSPVDESRYTVIEAMKFIKDYYISKRKNRKFSDYIALRGISADSVEKFEIGFADSSELYKAAIAAGFDGDTLQKTGAFYRYNNAYRDKFIGRVIFPINDQSGRCIGFGGRSIDGSEPKYLNSPETEIFKKSDHLYGYNLAKRGKYKDLILVEGYIDVVSMHDAGFDKTVACLGTTISERQIDLCWKVSNSPIVMLDGDMPGIKGAHRWVIKILPKLEPGKTFRFVKIPNDNDPDSAIKQGGTQYISDILNTACSLQEWLWETSFMLNPHETPEDMASVLKYISEAIDTIQDKTIKALYKGWFQEKERGVLFKRRDFNYVKKAVPTTIRAEAVPSKIIKIQEILLVTIINHPNILDRVIERFAMLDFKNSSYAWMQKEIVSEYSRDNNIENVVKKIYNTGIFDRADLRAGFLKKSSSDDEALAGWTNVLNKYIEITSKEDELGNIVSDLEKGLSYADWQRFKTIKKALLKDKRNEI